jgi:methionyl-tRNA formyltransferase
MNPDVKPFRVALFAAGGPFSIAAAEPLARRGWLCAIVGPPSRGNLLRRIAQWRRELPLSRAAARYGVPLVRYTPASVEALRDLDADLFLVATFPILLPAEVRGLARLGSVNAHPSLLPRHRGRDPIFWTLLHGDDESGVTLHWMDDGVDSGDVIAQRRIPVRRNGSGLDLYLDLARAAAGLIEETLPAIVEGSALRTAQDRSSVEPSPNSHKWRIDYAETGVAEMEHFLRGMEHRRHMSIPDAEGVFHPFRRIVAVTRDRHGERPGTIARRRIYLRDGFIEIR